MSFVRDRTLRRMHALIGTAAVATVACSDGKPTRKHQDDDEREVARGSTKDAGPSAHTGYAVVDPMPMPSRCSITSAEKTTVTATFEKERDLVVTVIPPPVDLAAGDPEGLQAYGAVGKPATTFTSRALEVKLTAAPDATKLSLVVPVRCDGERGALLVTVDWSVQGTTPKVLLTTTVTAHSRGF